MKVCDVCDLVNGRAFKPSDWGSYGLPIVRIQNLNNEAAPFNYYSGEYNPAHEINNGELLFSWSGTPGTSFGAFRWYRGKGILNQHIYKVVPKIDIDKDYLKYALNGNLSRIISKAHGGVGLQHITKKELNEITLRIVSNDEQRKIVALLNQTKNVIFHRQAQLAKLDELVKCRFVEMFGDMRVNTRGWENKTLGDACDVRDGTHDSPKYHTHGYPLVTSKNVTQGIIDFADCNLISEEDYVKISKRSKVDKGDIIMPMIGTVGCPVIVENDAPFAIKNVALIKFPDRALLLNIFVKHLLLSSYFETEVMNKVRGGTQKFISLSDIRKLSVFIPPVDLQTTFAAFVRRIDKLRF